MSTHAHDTEMCDDHPHTEPEPAVAFVPFLEPRSPPPLKPLKLHPAPSPDDPNNNNSSGSSSAQTSPPDPPRFAARVSQGSAFELCTQPETTPTAAAAMRGSGRPPLPVAPHVSPSCSPERNCRRCAELAAECAAKDQSIRALTQRLTRTAKLLETIQDLAEQQATHEQHSDFEMTSLEEKVARYRLALAGVVVDPASFEGHPGADTDTDVPVVLQGTPIGVHIDALEDSSRSTSLERDYTRRRRNSVGRHKVHGGSEFGFFPEENGGGGAESDVDARAS